MSFPLPYFDIDQLEMFLKCNHKYKLKYIDKVPVPLGIEDAIHAAVLFAASHRHFSRKQGEGEPTKVDLVNMVISIYNEEAEKITNKSKENLIAGQERAIRLVNNFYNLVIPRISNPIIVGEAIEIPTPFGVALKGVLELVHRDTEDCISVAVLNTQKGYTKNMVHRDMRLTFLSMLYRHKYKKLPNVVEVQNADLDLTFPSFYSERTIEDIKALMQVMSVVATYVSRARFLPPSGEAPWCSPEGCEYWDVCSLARRNQEYE